MEDTIYNCPNRRGKAVCQTEKMGTHCIHCGDYILGKRDGTMLVQITTDVFRSMPTRCIIAQQVNCQGVMGSGLAKAIRERYPDVFEQYRAEYELGLLELGYTSYVEVEPNIIIANICGQVHYGRGGKRYTDYKGLESGLLQVRDLAQSLDVDVVLPYKIGCGLGGGDWFLVNKMIEGIFKHGLISYSMEEV